MQNLAPANRNPFDGPGLTQHEIRLNQAIADYALESTAGAPPETKAFCDRFPDLENDLSSVLSSHQRAAEQGSTVVQGSGKQSNREVPSLRTSDGRYQLRRVHAMGGLGRVWQAWDAELGRDVAIKELRPDRSADPQMRARFLREAAIAGQLEHPGIVPIHELVEWPDSSRPFYSMRFVQGRTLGELAREFHSLRLEGKTSCRSFLSLVNVYVSVCKTIAYAHSEDVIHRDLKGDNVVVGDFGEAVVLDWGLAKRIGESDVDGEQESQGSSAIPETSPGLTLPGTVVGTPAYMAPEQANAAADTADFRTDVFGLGAILYEILTGQPPFTGKTVRDVLHEVLHNDPAPPKSVWLKVPDELDAICLRALEKQPSSRYESAADLAREVERWVSNLMERERIEHERFRFFGLAVDLLCIANADGYFTHVNDAWERTLGWTREDLVGKPWIEFVHPDDRQATLLGSDRIFSTGQAQYRWENRCRCKDGSYKWLSWSASLIEGENAVYAVARDVTEDRLTLMKERQNAQLLSASLSALYDGHVFLDSEGRILEGNTSNICGLTPSQLLNREELPGSIRFVNRGLSDDEIARLLEASANSSETDPQQNLSIEIQTADGTMHRFEVSPKSIPLPTESRSVVLIVFSRRSKEK